MKYKKIPEANYKEKFEISGNYQRIRMRADCVSVKIFIRTLWLKSRTFQLIILISISASQPSHHLNLHGIGMAVW